MRHLDFVFSAEDGYADLVKTDHLPECKKYQIRNDGEPFIIKGAEGINYGLIRLLEELSWQRTALPRVRRYSYVPHPAQSSVK